MAYVPISGSDIRLLSGLPLSNDYRNTLYFDTVSKQTDYFMGFYPIHEINQANFIRIEGKHYIRCNQSIDKLWNVNYIMFRNTEYNSKWFYAFVTKLEYVNKQVTHVHFEIDVYQTWFLHVSFKPSFVVREHCKLWNEDGSPVINTVDEGLNYGSEYDRVSTQNYLPYGQINFLVIVTKSLMHGTNSNKITPTLNGLPQPLSYYVHPFFMDGSKVDAIIGDKEKVLSPVLTVLKGLYTQDDAVNNVVSLYVTDFIGTDISYNSDKKSIEINADSFESVSIADDVNENFSTLYVKQLNAYLTKKVTVDPNKYAGFKEVSESKLLMYPYTNIILDDFKGNRAILKPEYINGKEIKLEIRGSLGTSNRVAYTVANYLSGLIDNEGKMVLEKGLINTNANDLPILNDYLSAYLQGNRNSIENQKDSIVFNGFMDALGGSFASASHGSSGNMDGAIQGGLGTIQGVGNSVLQMQQIQAKQSDISNTPPTLAKMGSNTQFDYGNGYQGLFIIKQQIKPEYRKKLTDFFNMFGYKVNEVKIPNFHTRKYWNYVQTKACYIKGNINNEDLQILKNIFDNGITLWHTTDVGNYSLENEVL